MTNSTPDTPLDIAALGSQLTTASEKTQLQMLQRLADSNEEASLQVLMQFLSERLTAPPTLAAAKAYQILYQSKSPKAAEFLKTYLPNGIVPLQSQRGIDYKPLQQLLAAQNFLEADRMTLQKLCEIVGLEAVRRKWLYFTEVDSIPITDLQTIDTLWVIHSEGKFGFSVQREIWLSLGKNWDKLWLKIGWKKAKNWPRYPQEFIWDLTAPRGHLPLSNQLRGVRVMERLLLHPALSTAAE